MGSVAVSSNATLIAESAFQGQPDPGLSMAPKTIIRQVAEGAEVASLDPSFSVRAFSADGSLVLFATSPDTGYQPSRLRLLAWQTGREVWHYDGPESLGSWLALPGGRDLALAFHHPTRIEPSGCGQSPASACSQVEDSWRDVVIVHPDGGTTVLPGRYRTLW